MAEKIAPEGKIWVCSVCGKTARSNYGTDASPGWDASCMLNAVLCHQEKRIDPKDGLLKWWAVERVNEE